MRKDIKLPEVKDIYMAAVYEKNELGEEEWMVYLVNNSNKFLNSILVASKGYGKNIRTGEKIETSTLRHFIENLQPYAAAKVERIMPDVFGLNNEYWLSFRIGTQMYDKKFVFLAESIKKENTTQVPIVEREGVLI